MNQLVRALIGLFWGGLALSLLYPYGVFACLCAVGFGYVIYVKEL